MAQAIPSAVKPRKLPRSFGLPNITRIHRDSLTSATRVRLTIKKRVSTISRWSCKTIRQPQPMSSPMVVAPAALARQICLAHALGITWYGSEESTRVESSFSTAGSARKTLLSCGSFRAEQYRPNLRRQCRQGILDLPEPHPYAAVADEAETNRAESVKSRQPIRGDKTRFLSPFALVLTASVLKLRCRERGTFVKLDVSH